ncbi:hypothetical protein [Phyllobacterium ifriqiyense]|uniref:hypothetical protein n=1 Tax=Phyllobacterium ifriqiyense TaxID=314238 RepID=UPI00339B0EE6
MEINPAQREQNIIIARLPSSGRKNVAASKMSVAPDDMPKSYIFKGIVAGGFQGLCERWNSRHGLENRASTHNLEMLSADSAAAWCLTRIEGTTLAAAIVGTTSSDDYTELSNRETHNEVSVGEIASLVLGSADYGMRVAETENLMNGHLRERLDHGNIRPRRKRKYDATFRLIS